MSIRLELTKRLVADSAFRETLVATVTQAATNAVYSGQGKVPTASELQSDIVHLELPIGWRWDTNVLPATGAPTYLTSWTPARSPLLSSGTGWFLKVIGLFISIAAISQGAPFWFDLLNKLTNLRAAGKPPARTST